jgi:hypothetical protein
MLFLGQLMFASRFLNVKIAHLKFANFKQGVLDVNRFP